MGEDAQVSRHSSHGDLAICGRFRTWWWAALVGVLALLLLLRGRSLAGAAWRNAGMLALRDELLERTDSESGAYHLYALLYETPVTDRMVQSLERALVLDGDSFSSQWALGRAALAVGDAETATGSLRSLAERAGHNPLLYSDVLTALSGSEQLEDVVALYELSPPPWPSRWISDTVALAYLEQSKVANPQRAEMALERAIELRPGDLYANFFLWKQAQETGNVEAAAAYRETMTYFPLDAIHPTDERLLGYAAEVIPVLMEEGLWDREKMLHAVSYLVREQGSVAGVEWLLRHLNERYPDEPEYSLFLAESYRRRGNPSLAEMTCREVLEGYPEYALPNLRLGMLAEEGCELRIPNCRKNAAQCYAQYYVMARDDLMGLKRLAEVCAALEEDGAVIESCQRAAELLKEGHEDQGTGRQETEERESPAEILWSGWLERVERAEPEYPVGQELGNGWTFQGYSVDEERLVRGEPVDLLLYWVGPVSASAGSESYGWYRAGERWVQVLEGVRNLVHNGGFELGVENRAPVGFPSDIYGADPNTRRLVPDVRAGVDSTVALLDNTEVYSRTSLASTWVKIDPDRLYLQAGWMRSAGGSGYIGRRWRGEIVEGVRPYDYVAERVQVGEWQHFAGLTRPLQGATHCQIWLLNYKALGQVFFDDISFVEIGRPGT